MTDSNETAMTAYEEIGPTRHLTSTEPQSPRSNAKTARLIAELGLRYRPSAQADLEAHAAMLALLTKDLASIDPNQLELAISRWVRTEKFMPRAAELVAMIPKSESDRMARLRQHMENGNVSLAAKGRFDVHWVIRNDELKLESR